MRRLGRTEVRSAARWVVVFGMFLALSLAWVLSNPPGAAPDEASHYVRLLGLAQGDVLGDPLPDSYLLERGFVPGIKLRHVQQAAGLYRIPGTQQPPDFCTRFHPSRPWNCEVPVPVVGTVSAVSLHAATPVASYVLPSLLAAFGSSTNVALMLGRLGYALQDALLLTAVVAALRRLGVHRRPLLMACVAMAGTPLLAFEMGTLAPNGTETLAIAAFAAWLLVAFSAGSRRDLAWAALLGGFASLTRDIAFLFVVFTIAVVLATVEHPWRTWQRFPRNGRRIAVGIVAGAVGFSALWYERHAGEMGPLDLSVGALEREVRRLWSVLLNSVSLVGSLDVKLDNWTAVVWWVVFGGVVGSLVRHRRAWRVVIICVVLWGSLTMALSITSQSFGYGVQARYTLFVPAVMVLCVVTMPTRRLPIAAERGILLAVAAFVSAMQFATLLINAERHATGRTSRPMSFSSAVWSPRVGWPAALTLCGVASAAFGLLVVLGGWGRKEHAPAASYATSDSESAEGVGQ